MTSECWQFVVLDDFGESLLSEVVYSRHFLGQLVQGHIMAGRSFKVIYHKGGENDAKI